MESTPPPPPGPLLPTGSMDRHGNSASSTSSPSSSLHAVRKPPAKPWKKPTAPAPPKVYHVDPRGFLPLVQRLTGASEQGPRRLLRDTAPAQLDVVPRQGAPAPPPPPPLPEQVYGHGGLPSSSTLEYAGGFRGAEVPSWETPQTKASVPSPNSLYSAYLTWCNLPLLSPGSMERLEQDTVL